jgi:SAM-dependent methyltransferase
MYSYFPFGEGSLDVVHSSWAYHDGLPRATLFEITRVLRPGGFFVLRQMRERTLRRVHAYAKLLRWRLHHVVRNCHLGDQMVVYQMPTVSYWHSMPQ